jgi:transcriptional regulator with XRE-family HTH domain
MIPTGIAHLDKITGGLTLGDNVVFQIASGVPIEYFIKSYFNSSHEYNKSAVYINFNYSPHTIYKRFHHIFTRSNVTLVDAFTHGKGNSDPVFLDFYNQETRDDIQEVVCIENPGDIASFLDAMNQIQKVHKEGSFYIFDSLTGMNELWKDEQSVLDIFAFTCPKLYDLNTIAYWVYEENAHSKKFIAGITHITQIVFAINNTDEDYYDLKVLKLEDRPTTGSAGIHRFRILNRAIEFQEHREVMPFHIGARVKELRKSQQITQSELARRLGMTPGAISQIENDITMPSLHTLVQLTTIFNKPLEYFISIEAQNKSRRGFSLIEKKNISPVTYDNITLEKLSDDSITGMQAFHITIDRKGDIQRPLFLHKGREFFTVIEGTINIRINDEDYTVKKGESMYLETAFIEKWVNPNNEDCQIIYLLL